MDRIVGLGEYVVSDNESDIIKAFALASCIAVTAYCPSKKAAGMIHLVLPDPFEHDDILSRPCFFVTTGIPFFINKMIKQFGCRKDELIFGVFGGANSCNKNNLFNIGERNINAAKNIFNLLNVEISNRDIGGTLSRTLEMSVATGMVKITENPIKI